MADIFINLAAHAILEGNIQREKFLGGLHLYGDTTTRVSASQTLWTNPSTSPTPLGGRTAARKSNLIDALLLYSRL